MIARLTGSVVEVHEKSVVIDVGGVGYRVFTAASFPIGEPVTIHTHLVIRDDAHELYGFADAHERALFETLIGVSGVGPKSALQMLALYPAATLVRNIKSGDARAISAVPGIGKKTAEKIIIDLKDKLDDFAASEREGGSDIVEALLSLGYRDVQIRAIVGDIDTTASLERQITEALRLLQK